MRTGERAEPGHEGDLPLVVEPGAAEDQRLVLEQRGVERSEQVVVEGVQVDAGDLRADPSADPGEVETGHRVFLSQGRAVGSAARRTSRNSPSKTKPRTAITAIPLKINGVWR
jgi:hypothetical protein